MCRSFPPPPVHQLFQDLRDFQGWRRTDKKIPVYATCSAPSTRSQEIVPRARGGGGGGFGRMVAFQSTRRDATLPTLSVQAGYGYWNMNDAIFPRSLFVNFLALLFDL